MVDPPVHGFLNEYFIWFDKWFSLFGREQFFILQSDALDARKAGKDGVAAVLRKLGGFLGLPAGDHDWERQVRGGYGRRHTASGYLGQNKSRMEELEDENKRLLKEMSELGAQCEEDGTIAI